MAGGVDTAFLAAVVVLGAAVVVVGAGVGRCGRRFRRGGRRSSVVVVVRQCPLLGVAEQATPARRVTVSSSRLRRKGCTPSTVPAPARSGRRSASVPYSWPGVPDFADSTTTELERKLVPLRWASLTETVTYCILFFFWVTGNRPGRLLMGSIHGMVFLAFAAWCSACGPRWAGRGSTRPA